MRKLLTRVGCIVLFLFCLVAAYPAFLIAMELENESQGQSYGDLYIFDPKKIFAEYEAGQPDLFSVISWEDVDDEVYDNMPTHPPSKWEQQDYLDVLDIFHETTFQGPFPKKIRGARFTLPDCGQISLGPQRAVFYLARINYPRATYYSYDVNLNDGNITWRGRSYDPVISWPISSLDLTKFKISAEQALQIAEEQGGEKARLSNGNQCDIVIDIDSDNRPGHWIVSYGSGVDQFTSLFVIAVDANTGQTEILAQGGAGYYSFDPQQIKKTMADGQTDVFTRLTERPEEDVILPPESWTQNDYYQIAQAFNRIILHEDLNEWKIHSISFELPCDDIARGPQQMRFHFWQTDILHKYYFVQEVIIEPRKGLLTNSYEYDLDVNRYKLFQRQNEILELSEIVIPGDEALRIVYEAEGKNLHEALRKYAKNCKMNGWLMDFTGAEDADSMEWDIGIWKEYDEDLGERPDQLAAFVNIKTGVLRYFKHYYGNLVE